ncbi:DUF2946 family protein [Bradyrhizobium sp. SZCCHNR2026]|uniref:DUF2946 family protein n=1 Tax=Bradyrhizobium sp. SZCCHNR2026 TaxID=3057381 RepID=UPI002916B6CE|nr:hypothetical protein [Bradyrhizobium sp. SZCCHNR2026]
MRHHHSHQRLGAGIIACAMAYVIALQLTLALTLNAWLPPDLNYAFGEICHTQALAGDDASSREPGPVKGAAHCPLCVMPAFALLPPPDAPAVTLRRTLGIVFEIIAAPRIELAEVHSSHRARAPPARVPERA